MDLVENEHIKYKSAFYIALLCGLRLGEILGITWNDINLEKDMIIVNKARSYVPNKGMFTVIPKTQTSKRIISMPKNLTRLLIEYKLWQDQERSNLGDLWLSEW